MFGIILTIASKVFAIDEQPNILRDTIRGVLPGANCGACGLPGCDAFAEAVATGKAPANGCPVGKAALAQKITAILEDDSTAKG